MLYNKLIALFILLVLVVLPTLRLVSVVYYSVILSIAVIFILLLILLSKVPLLGKAVIFMTVFYVTRNLLTTIAKAFLIFAYYKTSKERSEEELNHPQSYIRNIALAKIVYEPLIDLHLDFSKLPSYPSIFVCNYCNDRLENFACIFIPKNFAVLTRTKMFSSFINWPIYTKDGGNYDVVKQEIVEHTKKGRSILSYITNAPKGRRDVRKMKSGMFKIAKDIGIPITPLVIDYLNMDNFTIQKQKFFMEIGDTFEVDDTDEAIRRTKSFFRKTLQKFKKLKSDSS